MTDNTAHAQHTLETILALVILAFMMLWFIDLFEPAIATPDYLTITVKKVYSEPHRYSADYFIMADDGKVYKASNAETFLKFDVGKCYRIKLYILGGEIANVLPCEDQE